MEKNKSKNDYLFWAVDLPKHFLAMESILSAWPRRASNWATFASFRAATQPALKSVVTWIIEVRSIKSLGQAWTIPKTFCTKSRQAAMENPGRRDRFGPVCETIRQFLIVIRQFLIDNFSEYIVLDSPLAKLLFSIFGRQESPRISPTMPTIFRKFRFSKLKCFPGSLLNILRLIQWTPTQFIPHE